MGTERGEQLIQISQKQVAGQDLPDAALFGSSSGDIGMPLALAVGMTSRHSHPLPCLPGTSFVSSDGSSREGIHYLGHRKEASRRPKFYLILTHYVTKDKSLSVYRPQFPNY